MATYASLTDQQKADIATHDKALRSLFAAMSKAAVAANPLVLQAFSASRVTPVIAILDAGEVIPNTTDYGGSVPLTAVQFAAMQGLADQLFTLYSNNLVLLASMVGVNAQ